ncbi:MAG: hemerythrin family protein [Defluviitaleaceae bacterium]|nr:hemerythrin family protein [Defluviitaleaceae bacterium]
MGLWNETFATGNETVDADHKEIFELVEQVMSTSFKNKKEKVKTSIEFLADYVVRHFATEEGLMDESDYPHTETHKKEHADFLKVATKLHEDFVNDNYALGEEEGKGEIETEAQVLHLSLEINKTVVAWLTKHVMGSDRALADHYKKWVAENGVNA